MSRRVKRKYANNRTEFKKELLAKAKDNKALAMLIVQTYTAWHHRRHITQIWGMFINPEFKAFHKAYDEQLFGQHLTGTDDIWRSLYFSERELYEKYKYTIPETFVMGDALGVAYRVLKS